MVPAWITLILLGVRQTKNKFLFPLTNQKPTRRVSLPDFIEEMEDSVFYRYVGGLTVPGCLEIVKWSVFQSPIKISEAQANAMMQWSIQAKNNSRRLQERGLRKVYLCKDDNCTG